MNRLAITNRLGVHGLVFSDQWDEANAKAAIDRAAWLGFDVVEVLMFDPFATDGAMLRRLAEDAGIGLAVGLALGADRDLASADPQKVARGEAALDRAFEVTAAMGLAEVSGLVYAALNRYAAAPTPAQRTQVTEVLGRAAARAKALGLRLGLEPVNRYESYIVNTIDEAGAIIRATGADNMFIHLDTFHMNIEEGDYVSAIARNADLIGYVHLAESHRGLLGTGNFDFTSLFRALARAGYEGGFTLETFSPSVLGPEIVGGVGLWRTPWTDADEAATAALAFMQTQRAAAFDGQAAW